MDGKIKKFSTTFVYNTFPDSVIKLIKNGAQPKLFWTPDSAATSACDSYISQTITDNNVILVGFERYRSLVISIKVSQFLAIRIMSYMKKNTDCSRKQKHQRQIKQPQLYYSSTQTYGSLLWDLWTCPQSPNNHENFMEMTRRMYLLNPTGITFLSVTVWEI